MIANETDKKVLFLSITAGQGHNSASKAVADYLASCGFKSKVLDTYTFLNKVIGKSYDKGYTVLARHQPKSLESLYRNVNKIDGTAAMKRSFPFVFADLSKKKLSKYIERFAPSVIVCPHVLTCILITQLRKDGLIDPTIPCIGIITDYSTYAMWDSTAIDYFVIGADFVRKGLVKKGIPEEKFKLFGIPINRKFDTSVDQKQAREQLGLADMKTILVLSGGMGMGKAASAVEELMALGPDYQIVAICGSNASMKKKLEELAGEHKNLVVLGFTTNVDQYMDAADVVYTKPGGLSTTETLTKGKPLVLMKPIPGVEESNLAYFVNHSLACMTNTSQTGSMVIEQLLNNPEKLEEMKRARERLIPRDSSKNLGDFIMQLAFEREKNLAKKIGE